MKKVHLIFCLTLTLLLTGFLVWPRTSAVIHGEEIGPTKTDGNISFNSEYRNSVEFWSLLPAEPFRYGYISANVDCREEGQPRRMKFLSQIFAYCYGAVPNSQIIEDNAIFLNQVITSSCGENYSVSYKYLNGPNDTVTQATDARNRELHESGYGKHVEWTASVDYPSNCR
jgi:hypothetical protein